MFPPVWLTLSNHKNLEVCVRTLFSGIICKECDAHFEQKELLEYHMNKVHLNVKPYDQNFPFYF